MTSSKKFALVTGGSRRIGAAICRNLHNAGVNIMIHYRNSQDDAITLQKELNNIRKDSACIVQANLLAFESYEYIIKEMMECFLSQRESLFYLKMKKFQRYMTNIN